jgi:hypothetical protein
VVVFVVLGWSEAGLRRYNDLFHKVRTWGKGQSVDGADGCREGGANEGEKKA